MMKQIYTLFSILTLCVCAHATVKPRYRGAYQALPVVGHHVDEAEPTTQRRVGLLSTAPLTSTGSPRIPLILVQFADLRFTSGLAAGAECTTDDDVAAVNAFYHLYANGRGDGGHYTAAGSGGAIMEYFRDQSNGLFTPEFVIIGPVTLDKSYKYYGEDTYNSAGNIVAHDKNISAFYQEAISKAQALGVDWTQFDNDGDGDVDMAFFIYAGEGENSYSQTAQPETADYIWPHERPSGGSYNGVRYGAYACCNETYHGSTDGIGVFVHELSHAMGLPDLYDTYYVAYGMDYWDVMDSGNYCANGAVPCGYSAYEKDFMGWQPLVTLDINTPQHLVLEPLHAGGTGYKIVNPENENEYYVIENRQNKQWDTYIGRSPATLPDGYQRNHGLLITHIDYIQGRWTSNSVNTDEEHQLCTILPADGTLDSYMYVTSNAEYYDFLMSTAGDPFPGVQEVHALESEREPVYTTTGDTPGEMNQPLRNIVEHPDGTIELDYCPRGIEPQDDAIASTPSADTPAVVYHVNGTRMGTARIADGRIDGLQLPAGIYIVGQRKFVVH